MEEKQEQSFEEVEESPKRSFNVTPSDVYVGNKKPGSKIKFVLLSLIILIVLGVLFYLLRGRGEVPTDTASDSNLSEVASDPTPTPTTPSFDRSKFTLRVLNGTGKSGLAASAAADLKDLGYKIEKTSNATNSAFTKTIIRVKEGLSELLAELIKDLSPDFEATEGPNLEAADQSDAEIILGTN